MMKATIHSIGNFDFFNKVLVNGFVAGVKKQRTTTFSMNWLVKCRYGLLNGGFFWLSRKENLKMSQFENLEIGRMEILLKLRIAKEAYSAHSSLKMNYPKEI